MLQIAGGRKPGHAGTDDHDVQHAIFAAANAVRAFAGTCQRRLQAQATDGRRGAGELQQLPTFEIECVEGDLQPYQSLTLLLFESAP
jgi:hypothetical protein